MSSSLPDLDVLRKKSQFAGLMTLGGAAVVLLSIGYSVWRLGDTEATLAAEKKQVENLQGEVKTLDESLDVKKDQLKLKSEELTAKSENLRVKETALQKTNSAYSQLVTVHEDLNYNVGILLDQEIALDRQIKKSQAEKEEYESQLGVLRKEATIIREELKKTFSNSEKNLELWAKPEYRRIMATALLAPDSSYKGPVPKPTSPTGKWYDFTLRLKFHADPKLEAAMKRDIKSVTYEMNHPYLKVDPIVSKNADRDYAAQYEGAGTLRNVVVRIDVVGVVGGVVLDYDMTKAHPEAAKK